MMALFRAIFSVSESARELEVSTTAKSSETGSPVEMGLAFLTTLNDAQPARFNNTNQAITKLQAYFIARTFLQI
jgi:hypothetical protein